MTSSLDYELPFTSMQTIEHNNQQIVEKHFERNSTFYPLSQHDLANKFTQLAAQQNKTIKQIADSLHVPVQQVEPLFTSGHGNIAVAFAIAKQLGFKLSIYPAVRGEVGRNV